MGMVHINGDGVIFINIPMILLPSKNQFSHHFSIIFCKPPSNPSNPSNPSAPLP